MFSKACEYGIKASICIALRSQEGTRVGLNEISEDINSPVAFTAKVLQKLAKAKLVDSVTGPYGGFSIHPDKVSKIKLSQIVFAIDGDSIYDGCGLGFHHCNEKKPCPIHHQYKQVREGLKKMLETTTLLDLSSDIDNGITFLKQK